LIKLQKNLGWNCREEKVKGKPFYNGKKGSRQYNKGRGQNEHGSRPEKRGRNLQDGERGRTWEVERVCKKSSATKNDLWSTLFKVKGPGWMKALRDPGNFGEIEEMERKSG